MSRLLIAAAALMLLVACARTGAAPPSSESGPSSTSAPEQARELSESLPDPVKSSEAEPDTEIGASSETESSVAAYPAKHDGVPIEAPQESSVSESHAPAEPDKFPVTGRQEQPDIDEQLAPSDTAAILRVEEELLRLINGERRKNGLEALGVEADMQLAAGIRAVEALDHLSHTRPDGSPYHTAFDEAGFQYAGKWHGENLAFLHASASYYDEASIAAALFNEWSGSPGHLQNLLSENFIQTGIAVAVRQNGDAVEVGAAQLFASL